MSWRKSLVWKLILVTLIPVAAVCLMIAYVSISMMRTAFERGYQYKAETIVQTLDAGINAETELHDRQKLQNQIYKLIYLNTELVRVEICLPDKNGRLVTTISNDLSREGQAVSEANLQAYQTGEILSIESERADRREYIAISPIKVAGEVVGTYEVSLSYAASYRVFELQVIFFVVGMITLFGILAGLITLLASKLLTKPLLKLGKTLEMMGSGQLSYRAEITSSDEIGQLGVGINAAAERLEKLYESMDEKVNERTKEVESARIELEQQQLALMNVLEDVSAQKIYKEEESQSMLAILNEGIVVTDATGLITYVNAEFEKLLGFALAEVRGKRMAEITKPFDLQDKLMDPNLIQDAEVIKPENQSKKLQLTKKDGTKFPVVRSASPIIVNGEYRGVVRILHDYAEDLAVQRQKDDFFSIASHELRTPLTVISGSLDNLLQGYGGTKLSESDRKLVVDVMGASDRLTEMVEDFLNVSRLDQGRLKLEIKTMDACKLISKVIEEMTPLAASRGITLTGSPHTNKCDSVMADEGKLREIIVNLIGNSIKFAKGGSITVMHGDDGQGFLVAKITDTGIGIALDKQASLFQRFTQVMERTLAREAGGTGLGLYISREFARLMKGDLWLEKSELGKGSTFALKIPLAIETPKSVS